MANLFDKYLKKYISDFNTSKKDQSGGGGGAGAFTPEPYKPIDFGRYLSVPSTEEMSEKQNALLVFEKDYDELTTNIEKNYKLYKEFTKQLDDLEAELEEAPDEMQWNLTQKYNQLREQHNELVTTLQNDTERQKQVYQQYTKVRATYDKDIEIYNRWVSAKNAEEPIELPTGLQSKPGDKPLIEGLPMSKPEDEPDPTWGQMVYHTLKAGLNTANANFWNVYRMLEMGKIKAEDKIDDLFFPGAKDRNKKFEEKYGEDPNFSLPIDILTDLITDAEEIATESDEQAKSQNWLKQSINIGLRPVPQIAMSAVAGAAIPIAGAGTQVLTGGAKLTADFMKNWLRMTPFGVGAGAGKAREIEKKHIQLGEEAPYMKMLIGGVLTGLGEMATEMPVYLGVMRLLKHAGAGTLINKGAKTVIGKYGKAVTGALSNIFLQGIQEGEMYLIGKGIDQSLGDPQDWSKEDILEGTWEDFYGGLMMGFCMLGIGGGIGGSVAVATKSKRAFDRFMNGEDDLRTVIRKIAEYQGIILEEPTVEALAYRVEDKKDLEKDILDITEKSKLLFTGQAFGIGKEGDVSFDPKTKRALTDIGQIIEANPDLAKDVPKAIKRLVEINLGAETSEEEISTLLKGITEQKKETQEARKVEPKAPDVVAKEIVALHNKNQGSTYNLYQGDMIGKDKFAVSVKPELGVVVTGKKVSKKLIELFIEDNKELLSKSEYNIGTWYDEKANKTYIDISKTVDTLKEAVELGKENKQEAIFDLGAEEVIDVPKVEPQEPGEMFKGEAWRAETGTTRGETAKEIIDFEADEFGNEHIREDAEEVAKKVNIDLSKVKGVDLVWVTKTKKEANEYGEAEKFPLTKDNLIMAYDPDGGFLVLQNADKYIKVLPSDRIRSELIKKAEESDKKPTRDELIESEDLVIVRKEGEKYTYSEQWIENCWKALLAKAEYRGLDRTTAMEKFMKERFPNIAEANNLKIDNWDYTKGRLTVEMTPPKPPIPPKKTTKEGEPEGEPKKSLEEQLREARKEITRLRGVIKTIKGNAEKRQEFKKELVKYIKEYMPFAIQNKMLSTVKNVTGDKSLEKAFRKVIQYTEEYSRRKLINAIEKELKAKKIKPKRTKAGMLKGKFIPVVQDKLDFIRANRNSSRAEALRKIQENIVLFNQGKVINIAEENELLNMVGIKEMDLETLQSTLANIKKLKETGKTAKGEIDAVNKEAHEEDIRKTITVVTGKEVKIDEETGKAIIDTSYKTLPKTKEMSRVRKLIDKIINWQFGWDNLLDKLSSLDKGSKPYESDLSKIGDGVHYARVGSISKLEDALTLIQNKFVEAFDTTKKKDIMKITRKLREDIDLGTFKNSEGDTVHLVLNKEQIMKKIMQLDDPTLESTFTEGMFYTEEIENALRGAVSEKEMRWIGAVQQIYEYMWERINPIFEEMYGIHFPHNPNYSGTIRRDIDIDIPEASLMAQDAFRFASILNPSLKTRSRTKQSLKYDEMTASLMNYVMQMEHFINWAKPLQDLRSVFGDKRVKSVIHELYGEDTLNKINGFLDDMTRDGVDKAKIIKSIDSIRFNFTRSILAKPHIALKQIPSCLAYMTEMPVDDFIYGVANFWKNPLKNYRYIIEHSPYAKERFGAGFERDIHGAMQTDYRHLLAHSHKFSDIFMGMVRAGDKFAVMQGMWAKFYSETKGQVGKAKNAEEAMRRAEITTQRTQPSFTIESLATGQRGGSMLKLFTMFQNQPNKYFRIIADNARNFKAGRGNRAKAASNIVLAWVVLPMLFQFIGDGGKWYTPHQLRAMILGIFNDLLVFGSMIRGMYGWLIKEAYDVQASPVFSTLREAEYVLAKVAKYLDPEKDITPEDIQAAVEHFAKGLGQFIGLPTPYAIQVKKAITAKDYRQLLYSEYILGLGTEKKKKKKPYVKSYDEGKYSKYLKNTYKDEGKYTKYLKKY